MENKKNLTGTERFAYGIGAVGKDLGQIPSMVISRNNHKRSYFIHDVQHPTDT